MTLKKKGRTSTNMLISGRLPKSRRWILAPFRRKMVKFLSFQVRMNNLWSIMTTQEAHKKTWLLLLNANRTRWGSRQLINTKESTMPFTSMTSGWPKRPCRIELAALEALTCLSWSVIISRTKSVFWTLKIESRQKTTIRTKQTIQV